MFSMSITKVMGGVVYRMDIGNESFECVAMTGGGGVYHHRRDGVTVAASNDVGVYLPSLKQRMIGEAMGMPV